MTRLALLTLLLLAACSGVALDPGLTFEPGGMTIDPVLTER